MHGLKGERVLMRVYVGEMEQARRETALFASNSLFSFSTSAS